MNNLLCESLSAAWRNRRMVKLGLNYDQEWIHRNYNLQEAWMPQEQPNLAASLSGEIANRLKFKRTFGKTWN